MKAESCTTCIQILSPSFFMKLVRQYNLIIKTTPAGMAGFVLAADMLNSNIFSYCLDLTPVFLLSVMNSCFLTVWV